MSSLQDRKLHGIRIDGAQLLLRMELMQIPGRISRCVAWLNTNEPTWRKRIDIGRLDIQSCQWCMAGQLSGCGDWEAFLEAHNLSAKMARELCFKRHSRLSETDGAVYYHEATKQWGIELSAAA